MELQSGEALVLGGEEFGGGVELRPVRGGGEGAFLPAGAGGVDAAGLHVVAFGGEVADEAGLLAQRVEVQAALLDGFEVADERLEYVPVRFLEERTEELVVVAGFGGEFAVCLAGGDEPADVLVGLAPAEEAFGERVRVGADAGVVAAAERVFEFVAGGGAAAPVLLAHEREVGDGAVGDSAPAFVVLLHAPRADADGDADGMAAAGLDLKRGVRDAAVGMLRPEAAFEPATRAAELNSIERPPVSTKWMASSTVVLPEPLSPSRKRCPPSRISSVVVPMLWKLTRRSRVIL